MSDSPCTGCRSTRNGRLFFVYVNHYVGDEVEKRRCRFCRECIAELLAPVIEGADYQEGNRWIADQVTPVSQTTPTLAPVVAEASPVAPNIFTYIRKAEPLTPSAGNAG